MKNKFFTLFVILCLIVVTAIGVNLSLNKETENSKLLLDNLEALASSTESGGGSGLTLFTVCSRKAGSTFCTTKRGNRKWAISVNLKIEDVPSAGGDVECSECPDSDFDYED